MNFSGHGLIDLGAYDAFLSGKLEDTALEDEDCQEADEGPGEVPPALIEGVWGRPETSKSRGGRRGFSWERNDTELHSKAPPTRNGCADPLRGYVARAATRSRRRRGAGTHKATVFFVNCFYGAHGFILQFVLVLTMVLRMTRSLRMQATRATLGSLPALTRRW